MMDSVKPGNTPHRVEAFSDGVLAIAITLLVLDIKLPVVPTTASLAQILVSMAPRFLTTILSFTVIGCYWVNHHHLIKRLRKVDHGFLLLSLLWLLLVCFIPFPTTVLGDHFNDTLNRNAAITLYLLSLSLPAAAWSISWLYASHRELFLTASPKISSEGRIYIWSTGLHLGWVLLSLWFPRTALSLGVAQALAYSLPLPDVAT